MSVIVKTEAVVLRSIDFRETSKIVTFYTRQYGKIAGIVKGARQPKNKYGSSLEPMSYISLVFYKKEGREIQTVSSCDLIKTFRTLFEDLDKMAIGMAMIEMVYIVTPEHEENIPLFSHLVSSLNALNTATKNPKNLFYYFELKLAKILGFQPSLGNCIACKRSLNYSEISGKAKFNIEKGGLVCPSCSNNADQYFLLSKNVLEFFLSIQSSNDIERFTTVDMDDSLKTEIENFLWTFLKAHVHGLRSLKSEKVFSKIR